MKEHLKDSGFWINAALILLFAAVMDFFDFSGKLLTVIAVIFEVIGVALFLPTLERGTLSRGFHLFKLERKVHRTVHKGNSVDIYRMVDEELLPEARRKMPEQIYKYYSLGDDSNENIMKTSMIVNNKIWASTYSGFNDPFECQYMFLREKDLVEMGFPAESHRLWNDVMQDLRGRITTICFTQNPNNMPMWAHYANDHHGFCVEYKVRKKNQLYPVVYTQNRLKTRAFFINLLYSFFNSEASTKERVTVLRHFITLSTFKDKSWESENEIRAVFMNTKAELPPNSKGKLFDCSEIGVAPQKIYIGVKCSKENERHLIDIAEKLNIAYEKCEMSVTEEFGVVKK